MWRTNQLRRALSVAISKMNGKLQHKINNIVDTFFASQFCSVFLFCFHSFLARLFRVTIRLINSEEEQKNKTISKYWVKFASADARAPHQVTTHQYNSHETTFNQMIIAQTKRFAHSYQFNWAVPHPHGLRCKLMQIANWIVDEFHSPQLKAGNRFNYTLAANL